MSANLDSNGIELTLIADAAGSTYNAARVMAKLRCVTKPFSIDTDSCDGRIGREVMCSLKLLPERRREFWTPNNYVSHVVDVLKLNHAESKALKTMINTNKVLQNNHSRASIATKPEAFNAVKWVIETQGGWGAHEMRMKRKEENETKTHFRSQKKWLEQAVERTRGMADDDAREAEELTRELTDLQRQFSEKSADLEAKRSHLGSALRVQERKEAATKAESELDTHICEEKQRVKWKPNKRMKCA